MLNLLKKLKGKYQKTVRKNQKKKIDSFVAKYVIQNDLTDLIKQADIASSSTGADIYDYVILHSYVRKHKAKYILECGTGKSTWILAHALQKNHQEFGIEGKVVSMESILKWQEQAVSIFPAHLKKYAEILHSPATTYLYSFIKGTAFSDVPNYAYDLVFVDGPELDVVENGNTYSTVNMDFIRYVLSTDKPVTAIIDSRLRTCIAYAIIFGKYKVQFLKPWLVGIIENVSRKDMQLNLENAPLNRILQQTTSHKFANPSWINVEL